MARLKRVTSVFDQTELSEEFIFLGSIADLVETEMQDGEWEVVLNGRVLGRDEWDVTYPSDSCCVMIHPLVAGGQEGDSKAPLRTAMLIGVSMASMGVGSAIQGSFGLAAGATMSAGQTALVIAGMTATNILGGMLVNKLIPYPESKDKASTSLYALNSTVTQQQGLPLAMWYGQFKIKNGNVIAANKGRVAVNSTTIAETYDFITSYGLGPWEAIDSIVIPGALNAVKVEKDYVLGLISQRDFGRDFNYNEHNYTVDLTPFEDFYRNADPYVEFDSTNTLTFEIATTDVDKFDFDLLFPNGLYVTSASGGKYWGQVAFDISVADSASYSGGNYTWFPVATESSMGNAIIEGSIEELTRAQARWSYGSWAKHYVPTKIGETLPDESAVPVPVIEMVLQSRWLEFASSTEYDINAPPSTIPNIITGHTWRFIAADEPIEKVNGTSTKVTVALQEATSAYFNAKISGDLNAAYSVTSYVFKINFSRGTKYWVSEYELDNSTIAIFKIPSTTTFICGCGISLFNTFTDKAKILPMSFPRSVLVRVNGTAEKNVSSFIPQVSFRGRKVAVYRDAAWNFEYSNNPAWVCYDVLSQPLMPDGAIAPWTTTSPAIRYEGIDAAQLDTVSFKAWADFCDAMVDKPIGGSGQEKRYVFNGGFDEVSTLWEAALAVASMSQAWLIWSGSEIQVMLDNVTSATNLYTTGDYILDSVKESYLSIADRATAIEIEFIDEGKDYEINKFSVTESGFSDKQKKVALFLRGCSSVSQAYRSGKLELLKNKHLKKTVEFQAPLNAISDTVGDVIEFQSSVNKTSLGGGRIKSITSPTVLTLDRAYTFDIAKTYTLKVVKQDGTLITAALIALSGTTDTITLTAGITVAALDTYGIGETGLTTELLRIMDISQTTELLCSLSCIQYVPEIYDYNDSDVPNIIHSPVVEMPYVSITNISSRSYYDSAKVHKSSIAISFTKPNSTSYKQAKIYYRIGTADWIFAGISTGESFEFSVPTPGVEYTVAVATVNTLDIVMNILEAPSDTVTPSLVTVGVLNSLAATSAIRAVHLVWNHESPETTSGYKLYTAAANDFAGAAEIYSGQDSFFTYPMTTGATKYFWVKAIDSLGNLSAVYPGATAGVVGTASATEVDNSLVLEGSGNNIASAVYSNFEQAVVPILQGSGFVATLDDSITPYTGQKCLKVVVSSPVTIGFRDSGTSNNIKLSPNRKWITSLAIRSLSSEAACQVGLTIGGTTYASNFNTSVATSTWSRYSFLANATSNIYTYGYLNLTLPVGTFWLDAFMVEEQIGVGSNPSVYVAPLWQITDPIHSVVSGINLPTTGMATGLNVTQTYMGYYDGAAWKSYIGSDGDFKFYGSATKYIEWNSGTGILDIRGSLNADDITAGTITGRTLQTASSGKRFVVDNTSNEAHFYGDRGDTTIEELAAIGILTSGSDQVIGSFGTVNSTKIALMGKSKDIWGLDIAVTGATLFGAKIELDDSTSDGTTLYVRTTGTGAGSAIQAKGDSQNGSGIVATSGNQYGGYFSGGKAPVRLTPSASASAPTHTALKGSLWVTSDGVLYINTDNSTTWVKVGAQ